MPVAGGVAEPVTTLASDPEEIDHRWPELLPGGTALLFGVLTRGAPDRIAVKDLETGERRMLVEGLFPRYAPTGHILFVRENALWAAPFDVDRLELTGNAMPVLEGFDVPGVPSYAVAENGSLVYLTRGSSTGARELVWVDREGNEEPVAAEPRPYTFVRLSPDGRRVVAEVRDPDNVDVVIYDLVRDTATRFTVDPGTDVRPIWTPDGERVVFGSRRENTTNLFWKAADGTGQVEHLAPSTNPRWPSSISPDGGTLVFVERGDNRLDVGGLSMDGEPVVEWLLKTESEEGAAEISPDGNWLAYVSDESGQPEVYVRPFPNASDGLWKISSDGGIGPAWGPDGQELFYQSFPQDDGRVAMIGVTVDTEEGFSPGTPSMLFEGPYLGPFFTRSYDISPDGQRFLMVTAPVDDESPQIILVQNWHEELKRLVPVD